MSLITVIGRGHGGTRAMSHTLYASGVHMGEPLNKSGDLLPPGKMYDACRVFARYVDWQGDLEWDFSRALEADPPQEFVDLINEYLETVFKHGKNQHAGWKIPETTLCYPWIQKMFPDIKYIMWVRNPRDSILSGHKTDDMRDFGIEYPQTDDVRRRRAISWKYQYDLIRATPKPKEWIDVRFEDFVLDQENTLKRLEAFLGFPLARIIVRPDAASRWEKDDGVNYFDFFEPGMKEYGYEIPQNA